MGPSQASRDPGHGQAGQRNRVIASETTLPHAVENEYMRHPSPKYREEVAKEDSPYRLGEHTVVSLRVVTEVSNRFLPPHKNNCACRKGTRTTATQSKPYTKARLGPWTAKTEAPIDSVCADNHS